MSFILFLWKSTANLASVYYFILKRGPLSEWMKKFVDFIVSVVFLNQFKLISLNNIGIWNYIYQFFTGQHFQQRQKFGAIA